MKKLIVISSYPNTPEKEKTLLNCIDSVSNKGFDILVSSHFPLSTEVQKKIDYSIYDKNNTHSGYKETPVRYVGNDFFLFITNVNGHALAICRNMVNSFSLAKAQDYDYFIFIESDNILSNSDFDKLNHLLDETITNDKKMFFFRSEFDDGHFGHIIQYDTLIFGGKVSWFLENMSLPLTQSDWKNWAIHKILERDFYEKLKDFENNFLLVENKVEDYFFESIINKNTLNNICEVGYDDKNNCYVLFLVNFSNKHLTYFVNNTEIKLDCGNWWWSQFFDDLCIKCIDTETKELIETKFIEFNKIVLNEVKEKTYLQFY